MAILTVAHKQFLAEQDVPLSLAFDASGLSKSACSARMSELGMLVAYGVTPCQKKGHTLRSRSGHCIQCGTHNLAFLRRYDEDGIIYVGFSSAAKLAKIGTCGDVHSRFRSLCYYGYGGAWDWMPKFEIKAKRAGEVELIAHRKLAQKQVTRIDFKDGNEVTCQELFDCLVVEGIEAVKHAMKVTGQKH